MFRRIVVSAALPIPFLNGIHWTSREVGGRVRGGLEGFP